MLGVYSFPDTFSVGAILSFSRAGFQLSILACKHGRLRRPRRFFAVSAPFAFPKGRQKAQKLQKRIVQRQSLCTNATFEKPWHSVVFLHGGAVPPRKNTTE